MASGEFSWKAYGMVWWSQMASFHVWKRDASDKGGHSCMEFFKHNKCLKKKLCRWQVFVWQVFFCDIIIIFSHFFLQSGLKHHVSLSGFKLLMRITKTITIRSLKKDTPLPKPSLFVCQTGEWSLSFPVLPGRSVWPRAMWIWRVVQDPRSLPLVLIGLGGRKIFFEGEDFLLRGQSLHVYIYIIFVWMERRGRVLV